MRRSGRGAPRRGADAVYFDGPDRAGLEAATTIGEGPYTYEVELVIDGARYLGTAVWADDEIKGKQPSVTLAFDPPLPSDGARRAMMGYDGSLARSARANVSVPVD